MGRALAWWQERPGRVKFAWVLLVISFVGWPVSQFTFARGEPPTVLGLSWLAVAFTAVDILFTSQVHEKQDNAEQDGSESGAGDNTKERT